MDNTPDVGPLMYPYHLGPAVRRFSTTLLFHDRLVTTVPAWVAPEVLQSFYTVGDRVHGLRHGLEQVFSTSAHFLELAQKQAIARQKAFEPLGSRFSNVFLVYSGTPESYAGWEPAHSVAVPLAAKAIAGTEQVTVAAVEFVWRVFELWLELDEDPDRVIAALSDSAGRLGEPMLLLAECYINRLGALRQPFAVAMDSATDLAILNELGRERPDEIDLRALSIEQTSFALFDQLLEPYTPPLDPPRVAKLASLLDARSEELRRMRLRCTEEARRLVDMSGSVSLDDVRAATDSLEEEVRAIAELDSRTWASFRDELMTDSGTWMAIAGMASAAAGSPVLGGSLALTALAAVGASALRGRRAFDEALSGSPWSVVYYLAREQGVAS